MLAKLIAGYQRWAWIPWLIGVGFMVAGLTTLRQPLFRSSSSYRFDEQGYLATIGIRTLIILILLSGLARILSRMRFVWDLVWITAALLMLCGLLSWSGTNYSRSIKESSRSRYQTEISAQDLSLTHQRAAWFVLGGAFCVLITSSILMLEPPDVGYVG